MVTSIKIRTICIVNGPVGPTGRAESTEFGGELSRVFQRGESAACAGFMGWVGEEPIEPEARSC